LPDYHRQLLAVSLNKGALATTAIEGNTLTEEEWAQILSGKDVASSKKYQQAECYGKRLPVTFFVKD